LSGTNTPARFAYSSLTKKKVY